MLELNCILKKINELRDYINNLINQERELIDPEVLVASKELDELINTYAKQMKSKNEKV